MSSPHKKRPNRSKRSRRPADGRAAAEAAALAAMLDRLAGSGGTILGAAEAPPDELGTAPPLNVILSSHAERQLHDLGAAAEHALSALSDMSYEEIRWSSERLPPQRGREVRMLWAGSVRILFDIEDDDLTVQGFGLRPRW